MEHTVLDKCQKDTLSFSISYDKYLRPYYRDSPVNDFCIKTFCQAATFLFPKIVTYKVIK